MRAKVFFSPLVKEDLKEVYDWYKKINIQLGSSFLQDYHQKIKYLPQNPAALEIRYENQLICFLDRFPYGIHYEFIEQINLVRMFAVLHTSRNPKIWSERTTDR